MPFTSRLAYPAVRVSYDVFASIFALALAFCSRAIFEVLKRQYPNTQQQVFESYVDHFLTYAPLFAFFTVATFALFGFYKQPSKKNSWKPLISAGVSVLPVLLFGMAMYLLAPKPDFSRGAMLFLSLYSLVLLGAPRILKYYIELSTDPSRIKSRKKVSSVLVIGGAGYIGSQLSRDFLNKGYKVKVLDSMVFGEESIKELLPNKNFELIRGDLRNVESVARAVKDVDAVVLLAGIVGDPACSLDDDFTTEVNLSATRMVAEVCKTFNIQRLVFASTCSVYGQSQDGKPLDENSELRPVSLYAKTKIASEKVLMNMESDTFQPTILRFATLFGLSPRPRFDLAVNVLSARAAKFGEINVFGGNQWRPFVHVRDICKAVVAVIEAPIHQVGGEVFNIGSNKENHKIIDVGQKVGELIPGTNVVVDDSKEDERNYNVKFDKLTRTLGVELSISVEDGIKEIAEAVKSGEIEDFLAPLYSNVKLTEKLLEEHINVDAPEKSHHKKTSKALLKQVYTQ